jgi:hypothetical protein
MAASTSATASDLIITGVIDGPLTGGVPKAVEIYVVNNVAERRLRSTSSTTSPI